MDLDSALTRHHGLHPARILANHTRPECKFFQHNPGTRLKLEPRNE